MNMETSYARVSSMSINTFIFMGCPGAGKGVQSALLSEKLNIPVFSTGNRVREISKQDHNLGKRIRSVQEAGGLTPYWFASFLFQEALFANQGKGIIFEGVGRKEPEARLFAEVHEWLNSDFRIFNLVVSRETAFARLVKRGELDGRADDAPDRIPTRLELFEKETLPAIEFFRSIGKVVDIDGEGTPEEVSSQIMDYLKQHDPA